MARGVIFDIQRYSIYDGPGIRTTVFLKGCPLRCIWCHNPESQSANIELSFKQEKCAQCGICGDVCPNHVHRFDRGVHTISRDKCVKCGRCVSSCPYGALKLYGREIEVREVMKEVLKDIKYYKNSGGGMTISGGEPLFQPEFTAQLLQAAKYAGIDTCIETCGYAGRNVFKGLFGLVDLYIFDYKVTDKSEHQKLTGVDNELIMGNLQYLYDRGRSIILRCPLVPGINDTKEHLAAIAALCSKYPMIKSVEIMPYHNMGRGKYTELGRKYSLANLKNTDKEQEKKWLEYFDSLGCKNIKCGSL